MTLVLNKAFKHNPKRKRESEPEPVQGIGKPPAHLTPRQQKIWHELVAICAPGVLTQQDRPAFELVVVGLDGARHGYEIYSATADAMILVPASTIDVDRVFKQLGKFGMTPSERSNVVVPKTPEKKKGFGRL